MLTKHAKARQQYFMARNKNGSVSCWSSHNASSLEFFYLANCDYTWKLYQTNPLGVVYKNMPHWLLSSCWCHLSHMASLGGAMCHPEIGHLDTWKLQINMPHITCLRCHITLCWFHSTMLSPLLGGGLKPWFSVEFLLWNFQGQYANFNVNCLCSFPTKSLSIGLLVLAFYTYNLHEIAPIWKRSGCQCLWHSTNSILVYQALRPWDHTTDTLLFQYAKGQDANIYDNWQTTFSFIELVQLSEMIVVAESLFTNSSGDLD